MRKPFLLLSIICLANIAISQVGNLDPTFGINGIEKIQYVSKGPLVSDKGESFGLQIMPDSYNPTVRVYKYQSNGLPDASYGTNGFTVPVTMSSPNAAIQNDGKILVFGSIVAPYYPNVHNQIRVARFNVDGSLDNTFGTNGIRDIVYNNNLGTAYTFRSKLVKQGEELLLFNFIASAAAGFGGDYVNTFSSLGTNRYTISPARNKPLGLSEHASFSASKHVTIKDSKIVVAGLEMITTPTFPYNVSFGYYLSKYINNTPDVTFGANGMLPLALANRFYENMKLDAQDRVLMVNSVENSSTGKIDFVIKRLNKNGSPDQSFGDNGSLMTDFGGDDSAYAIVLHGDKIIVGGSTVNPSTGNKSFAIARYNEDGSLDKTFGYNGIQTTGAPGKSYLLETLKIEESRLIAKGTIVANSGSTYKVTAAYLLQSGATLSCRADLAVPTDKSACSAVITDLDPQVSPASANTIVKHTMAGATKGSGTGSVSGKPFNKGVTIVTYSLATEPAQTCSFRVTVEDKEAPVISGLTASPRVIWLSNHKMVNVQIKYKDTDNCGVVRKVVTVTSNEAQSGLEKGDIPNDWIVEDPNHIKVRAERSEKGQGRTYTIKVTAYDEAGNKSDQQAVTVVVPHNKSNKQLSIGEETNSILKKEAVVNEVEENNLDVKVLANPSTHHFTLVAKGNTNTKLTVTIVDASGRMRYQKTGIAANGSLTVGNELAAGVYFAEVRQGEKKVVLRLVKQ